MKTVESPYLNMTRAAARLGLSKSQLSEAARAHPLYAPDVTGIPTGRNANLGVRLTRYHVEHVRIIERVLLGMEALETAWIRWQVERNRIGAVAHGPLGNTFTKKRRTG